MLRPEEGKKDIEIEDRRRCEDFVLVSFLEHCVFSAMIFPDFSIGARTRVDASEGRARMNARVLPPRNQREGAPCTMSVVNGRNLYDPRKQITGATLTSRSITLGRTSTSAF